VEHFEGRLYARLVAPLAIGAAQHAHARAAGVHMSVFELPPSESCNRKVSLEFRYGTCFSPFASAAITVPSAVSDWLMPMDSLAVSPATSDCAMFGKGGGEGQA